MPRRGSFLLVTLLILGWSAAPAAAFNRVEITPYYGYVFGGSLATQSIGDIDIKSSSSYGLWVDIMLNENMAIDLQYSRQDTELKNFPPSKGPLAGISSDFNIEYYQVNFLYQWDPNDTVYPFFLGGIGATRLDLVDGSSDTLFSWNLAGGAKFMPWEHIGFRLQGTWNVTYLNSNTQIACGPFTCFTYNSGNYLNQLGVQAGVIIGF